LIEQIIQDLDLRILNICQALETSPGRIASSSTALIAASQNMFMCNGTRWSANFGWSLFALARTPAFRQRNSTPSEKSFKCICQKYWRPGMNTVGNVTEARLLAAQVTEDEIIAHLMDGRTISVPLTWSWRLSEATAEQRQNFAILGDGQGIHWPEIDEDISVEGMLYGSPARRPHRQAA
jgi:hypothetical protein